MNLKAQDRIFKFLRFTKLVALILTLCIMSCVTAYADTAQTTYIDENGIEQTVDATVLTGKETWLPEGWYVVKDSSPSYTKTLLLGPNADVRIILANGGTMTIDASSRGIQCNDSGLGHLYIYGQKNGSGTLTIDSAGTGIRVTNYTQNGGTVNITAGGVNTNGIFAASTVKINGGNLTISSSSYAIYAGDYADGTRYKGYITINDGQVSADKGFKAGPQDLVYTRELIGEITLGLASSDSYIKAGGYQAGTVKVAENESLFVEGTSDVLYSGTLTSDQLDAIEGKTLKRGDLYSYIDADGIKRYTYATPIKSSTTTQTLSESWYIVNENVTIESTTASSSTALRLTGSAVNIILADGAKMTIGSTTTQFARGLGGSANLNIYGQDSQTGTLEIYAYSPIDAGTVFTQNGGNIILSANSGSSTYACGIHAGQKVNINNGTLSMDIKGSSSSYAISVGHGAYGQKFAGSITISGGKVKVSGAKLYAGYSSDTVKSTITLGYRNTTDYISVTSCDSSIVKVADGQVLAVSGDTGITYKGDITGSKNAIVGKILIPYEVYTISYDYGLNNGESLLDEGYIMLVSLDESVSGVSLAIDNTTREVYQLSEDTYIAIFASSDLSASKFTLKATNSDTTTSFIFVSENPADDLMPGTHDIAINSSTTKGTYIIAGLNAGNLNPGAYSTSALPLTLLDPERKGYTFAGWTGTGLTQATKNYEIPTGTKENLTLTANWTLTSYDIGCELNDGEYSGDANPEKYSVLTETFTLNNPIKDGYTFLGWTGTGLNGAVQSVMIPTGSTGNRTYTAMWRESFTPSGEKPKIVQHAMILGSQIVVMFYVYYPESYTPADYKMGFVISGDLSENPNPIAYTESSDLDGSKVYAYPCYVNSIQMADTIHATLYDNAETPGVVLSEDYTAKTYLDRVIDSADVFSSQTIKLCETIKNYGSYVQIPLAEENEWVIGTDHVKMDSVDKYGDDDVLLAKQATEDYALSKDIYASGLKEFTYALYLDSKITLEVVLKPDDNVTIQEGLTCTYSDGTAIGDSLTIDTTNNTITIADISAHELGNMYKITGKATSDFSVTISPLSYVYSILAEEKSSVNGIEYGVTSLYNYYDRTMKYRHSHSSEYSDEGTSEQ